MTIGLIGLDNNGILLAQALNKHKITVIGYDYESTYRKRSAELGIVTTSSIQAVVLHLPSPRIVWNLSTEKNHENPVLEKLIKWLSPNDIIIDSSGNIKENLADNIERIKKSEIQLLLCNPVQPKVNAIAWISGDAPAFKICKPLFVAIFGDDGYQYMGTIQ